MKIFHPKVKFSPGFLTIFNFPKTEGSSLPFEALWSHSLVIFCSCRVRLGGRLPPSYPFDLVLPLDTGYCILKTCQVNKLHTAYNDYNRRISTVHNLSFQNVCHTSSKAFLLLCSILQDINIITIDIYNV